MRRTHWSTSYTTTLVDIRTRDDVHGSELTRVRRGESVSVAAGAVHGIANDRRRRALSVHLYSPRLVTMTFHHEFAEVRPIP